MKREGKILRLLCKWEPSHASMLALLLSSPSSVVAEAGAGHIHASGILKCS